MKKSSEFFKNAFQWLGKRSWIVVTSVIVFLILFEFFELFQKKEPLSDPFHIIEISIYAIILVLLGLMINLFKKAESAEVRMMEILNFKHQLSLKLIEFEDWGKLVSELVKLPSSIAPVEASRLHVFNPISRKMEDISDWNDGETEKNSFQHDYQKYLEEHEISDLSFGMCLTSGGVNEDGTDQPKEYCLPIIYTNTLLGLFQFKLKTGMDLSEEQAEIFESIRPEITMALKAAWEQRRLSEIKLAETALAERHTVSTYLHDNLSQNLAYICLKLDQLTTENELVSIRSARSDLQSMKAAAQTSYEIVRSMLEETHSVTTPRLINLIRAHAQKVSTRAQFKASIKEVGEELPILPELQQTVFYVFQEALNNVEKHARAKNVVVLVNWGEENLNVTVSDDGIGFSPHSLNGSQHIGLDIMRERVDRVNGRVDIRSSESSGTEIAVFIPIVTP